ncbi:DUF2892 domain-containing protein [Haloferax sp. MBLA0076]|uniref:DUF2892 domain-containing protein n=1 Tax=Haloferax litoreum TaxID=2666140 RepID=A0A6A8GG15_9EURY|nr:MULTISPECIES: YgaP-like transmembrane domain [Haloferax]KAB1193311.1 DUF2892 domain-containing protein [Haloferax sp. CBA1148]MRX21816.1 DUF2892 domain-containing protein [Haloferax litoreum]
MKHNVGSLDRMVRFALGALLGVLGLGALAGAVSLGPIPAMLGGIVALVLGVVLVVTGYRQTCPLYLPFGINTSGRN